MPRPCRLKPQGLVRVRADASHGFRRAAPLLVEGNDAAALRSARGVPQAGFAAGRPPLIWHRRRMPQSRRCPRSSAWHRAFLRCCSIAWNRIGICGDAAPTGRRDHRYRLVVRHRRAPHPHTWTLAAELRPSSHKGLTAVAMRPQAQSPVCGWGSQSTATGRALSALTKLERYVQSIHARAVAKDAVL